MSKQNHRTSEEKVDVTGEIITNWRLPEAESLESLEELGEIMANVVVVLAVSQWVRNMLFGLTRAVDDNMYTFSLQSKRENIREDVNRL